MSYLSSQPRPRDIAFCRSSAVTVRATQHNAWAFTTLSFFVYLTLQCQNTLPAYTRYHRKRAQVYSALWVSSKGKLHSRVLWSLCTAELAHSQSSSSASPSPTSPAPDSPNFERNAVNCFARMARNESWSRSSKSVGTGTYTLSARQHQRKPSRPRKSF